MNAIYAAISGRRKAPQTCTSPQNMIKENLGKVHCLARQTSQGEKIMKKIVLTGGGTAGHVTPNIALFGKLRERGYELYYIGSYEGMEKDLIEEQNVPYYGISTGKLRRYFDLQNFTDPLRVIHGFGQARRLLRKIRPDIVFSKGGYVSVPVVRAAHALHIPVIIHESDMTPGLANKLSFSGADVICCNFPETLSLLPAKKAVLTGSPIRSELLSGDRAAALSFTGLSGQKPVLMIIGGSLGSVAVNNAVRSALPQLLDKFDIVHLCGKGNTDESLTGTPGYVQYEYIGKELPDLYALSDLVISRAGANVICELLALHKPMLLIPLPAAASRGDQLLNAESFKKQGFAKVLQEEDITPQVLTEQVISLYDERQSYISAMEESNAGSGVDTIIELIEKHAKA